MANPNIVSVSDIRGKTSVQAVGTTATAIVSNNLASDKIIKVNSVIISNISAQNQDITVDVFRNSTSYYAAYAIAVPPNATLVIISKDTSIYLEEGDSLRLEGSGVGVLHAICSYEEIS
jgi:hypothetical protein